MGLYLITGGAGFIGSHLADQLLLEGHQVRVFDNLYSGSKDNLQSKTEFIHGDITSVEDVTQALEGVDGCFHLAAIASVDVCEQEWRLAHAVNALGTLNVFKAIAQYYDSRIPVVFASSAAVYGLPSQLPLTEQSKTAPISNYGLDKLYGEQVAKLYAEQHGVHSVCLRFFNVYGTRQQPDSSYSGVISKFIYQRQHNQPIKVYGDGHQTRDFILVNDLTKILSKVMDYVSKDNANYMIANVGTGKQTSIIKLASIIAGKEYNNFNYLPKKKEDIIHSFCDNGLLQTILDGEFDFTSLPDGLSLLMG